MPRQPVTSSDARSKEGGRAEGTSLFASMIVVAGNNNEDARHVSTSVTESAPADRDGKEGDGAELVGVGALLSVCSFVAEDAMILLVAILLVAATMSADANEGNVMSLLSAVAAETEDDAERTSAVVGPSTTAAVKGEVVAHVGAVVVIILIEVASSTLML